MLRRLKRYNVNRWATDFLTTLVGMREVQNRIESKLLTPAARAEIIARYRTSRRRLLFLDYDGTLTPLVRHPGLAGPDPTRRELLRVLTTDGKNTIVVASGRERQTLDEWLGDLPIGLVAEHGAWLKDVGEGWRHVKPLSSEWKRELLPILETYADRLAGALVEEKEDSVAWHFRMADPEQAALRAPELIDHLISLVGKTDLQVIQGDKVVEIRHAGINKGGAALAWISQDDYDFILGIGDDTTDEDFFRALPGAAFSIRVGMSATRAQYNIQSSAQVIELLRSLVDGNS
jgi:trehalose 6-phosphate synthase/phosphatase